MTAHEVNFDGLVGPTHNYAGLSFGNLASARNKGRESSPKKAALEGLAKMKFLMDLGVRQAVLPPHERPDIGALRAAGFSGTDEQVLKSAARQAPALATACCSASAMWTANAATVSPSSDTRDGRVHFTPANLLSQLHRSLEPQMTARVLARIFADPKHFVHHPPLPKDWTLADEGAANHMRLSARHGSPGVEIFVYGREANEGRGKWKFPARQTLEASRAVAAANRVRSAIFVRQKRLAIDAGAFHNDVVAASNLNVLLYHEEAWEMRATAIRRIRREMERHGALFIAIKVSSKQISLADAVRSYLFNSQLVSLPEGGMALIAPQECRRVASVRRFLDEFAQAQVHYVPVRQSMRNGGGPACLRLRVVLTDEQIRAAHRGVFLTPGLYEKLVAWVKRHYRETLTPGDLPDPKLMRETRRALDELTHVLKLGSIYDFQR